MIDTQTPDAGDPDILAAELAFGLIDAADVETAHRLLDTDAAFRAAHNRWFGYALAMVADSSEPPPEWVWEAIERRLPANDTIDRLNRRLARWRMAAMAASVALLATTTSAVWLSGALRHPVRHQAPTAAAPMVAMLRGTPGAVSIAFDPAHHTLTVASSDLGIDSRHTAQLWVIPADGRPRSLGVLPADHPTWRTAPGSVSGLLTKDATLAVSIEPAGGSTTGLPTGPVILTGKLALAG
jgi:anti-sigma-K factor RskA